MVRDTIHLAARVAKMVESLQAFMDFPLRRSNEDSLHQLFNAFEEINYAKDIMKPGFEQLFSLTHLRNTQYPVPGHAKKKKSLGPQAIDTILFDVDLSMSEDESANSPVCKHCGNIFIDALDVRVHEEKGLCCQATNYSPAKGCNRACGNCSQVFSCGQLINGEFIAHFRQCLADMPSE
jgi:hypothetical protein